MADAATNDRYTVIRHAPWDSPAGRCLKPAEFALLTLFLRRHEAEVWAAQSQRRKVRPVPFTFVCSPWPMTRATFDSYRRALVLKGFIAPIHTRSGLYTLSEDWQTYSPSADEIAALDSHAKAQALQVEKTAEYRKCNAQKSSTGESVGSDGNSSTTHTQTVAPNAQKSTTAEQPAIAQKSSNRQCAKTDQPLVADFRAHKILDPLIPPPPPSYSPELEPGAGGGGEALPDKVEAFLTRLECLTCSPDEKRLLLDSQIAVWRRAGEVDTETVGTILERINRVA